MRKIRLISVNLILTLVLELANSYTEDEYYNNRTNENNHFYPLSELIYYYPEPGQPVSFPPSHPNYFPTTYSSPTYSGGFDPPSQSSYSYRTSVKPLDPSRPFHSPPNPKLRTPPIHQPDSKFTTTKSFPGLPAGFSTPTIGFRIPKGNKATTKNHLTKSPTRYQTPSPAGFVIPKGTTMKPFPKPTTLFYYPWINPDNVMKPPITIEESNSMANKAPPPGLVIPSQISHTTLGKGVKLFSNPPIINYPKESNFNPTTTFKPFSNPPPRIPKPLKSTPSSNPDNVIIPPIIVKGSHSIPKPTSPSLAIPLTTPVYYPSGKGVKPLIYYPSTTFRPFSYPPAASYPKHLPKGSTTFRPFPDPPPINNPSSNEGLIQKGETKGNNIAQRPIIPLPREPIGPPRTQGWVLPPPPSAFSPSRWSDVVYYPPSVLAINPTLSNTKVIYPVRYHNNPDYYHFPSSYHYSYRDTGSDPFGIYLYEKLSKLETPTYHHYKFYEGYRPKYDHYKIIRPSTIRNQSLPQIETVNNDFISCNGDVVNICTNNTLALCTNNGTFMCAFRIPLGFNSSEQFYVNTTIPCFVDCGFGNDGTNDKNVTVQLPCLRVLRPSARKSRKFCVVLIAEPAARRLSEGETLLDSAGDWLMKFLTKSLKLK